MTATTRPDGFDAALIAYLPKMRRRALRVTKILADDLVYNTVVMMLEKAHECRMETFKTWAAYMMLRVSSDYKRKQSADKRTGQMLPEEVTYTIGMDARQDGYVELSQALDILASIPGGDLVLQDAMGETLSSVELGRSKYESLRFRRQKARKKFAERMAA